MGEGRTRPGFDGTQKSLLITHAHVRSKNCIQDICNVGESLNGNGHMMSAEGHSDINLVLNFTSGRVGANLTEKHFQRCFPAMACIILVLRMITGA